MKTAVIEAGLAQMVAIGVGAGVGKLMGMALSPWEWPGRRVQALRRGGQREGPERVARAPAAAVLLRTTRLARHT